MLWLGVKPHPPLKRKCSYCFLNKKLSKWSKLSNGKSYRNRPNCENLKISQMDVTGKVPKTVETAITVIDQKRQINRKSKSVKMGITVKTIKK